MHPTLSATTDKSAGRSTDRLHRVLIVDDHPMVREGLATLIGRQPDMEVCGEAASETAALQLAQRTRPHLTVIDITLQDGDGLDLVRRLSARPDPPRMLVTSAHDESLFAERALSAGAHGFLSKHGDRREVVAALRRVVAGRVYLSERMQELLLERRRPGGDGAQAVSASPLDALTDRQLVIYELIGQGLQRAEIAERLHVSPKTVETHRQNIKEKLHLGTTAELIRHAIRSSLIKEGGLNAPSA